MSSAKRRALAILFSTLLLGRAVAVRGQSEVHVELQMERWAARGGAVRLRCVHDVPHHLLDKVVFLRNGTKIYQYIKNRKPPFRNFTTPGAVLNIALATEDSITLQDLQFAASGSYSCEVSIDTPIYTKASVEKQLTVFHPQKHNPRIDFPTRILSAGDVLRANCTSAPALPAPHITWFINSKKMEEIAARSHKFRVTSSDRSARVYSHRHVDESSVFGSTTVTPISLSHSTHVATRLPGCNLQGHQVWTNIEQIVHGHQHATNHNEHNESNLIGFSRHRGHRPGRGRDLYITVSELQLVATGRLEITCVSTIPEFRSIRDKFADVRNDTVIVEVIIPSPFLLPVANRTIIDNTISSQASKAAPILVLVIFNIAFTSFTIT